LTVMSCKCGSMSGVTLAHPSLLLVALRTRDWRWRMLVVSACSRHVYCVCILVYIIPGYHSRMV
jgi:hypothetical protein